MSITEQERLLAHQEEPQCASCHRKIDPIGFGLENFDAIGRWRETDDGSLSWNDGKQPAADAAAAEVESQDVGVA